MERQTKRIIAIVAILAVAGAGTGVGIWFILQPPPNPYDYPGYSLEGKPSLDSTIKIGILDDMSQYGPKTLAGATLAAKKINENGGVSIGGKTYWVGLVSEDTAETALDFDKAKLAVATMIDHEPHAVLGGFRSEVFESYVQDIIAADIPFMITGSATTDFCQDWVNNTYEQYKWLFRCMPLNSHRLGVHLGYLLTETGGLIDLISAHQGFHVDHVYIVYEDLKWTADIKTYIEEVLYDKYPNYFGYVGLTQPNISSQFVTKDWTETDFDTLWNDINTSTNGAGRTAQIIVPIISDSFTSWDFSADYASTAPEALIAGINVGAQTGYHMTQTGGGGIYEISAHSVAKVNFTQETVQWFDDYEAYKGESPVYTSVGGYDAVGLFVHAINTTQSLTNLDIVSGLEALDYNNPYQGVIAQIGFDVNHDVLPTVPSTHEGFFGVPWRQMAGMDGTTYRDIMPLIPCDSLYDIDTLAPSENTANVTFPHWWPEAP
jgi:ABC-type branched-subunit amino acid transport system substrate-binding protein